MRICRIIPVFALSLCLGACSRNHDAERKRSEDQTAGEKAGSAAYWASKHAEKALKSAAHQVGKAAQQAHQGWTEAEREDRAKREKKQTDRQ